MTPPHWQRKALGTDITLRTNQRQVSRQLLMVLFPYREGLPRPPPLLAQANLPFGYPVHGVEVMPLHTIPIPGRYLSIQKTETTFFLFLLKQKVGAEGNSHSCCVSSIMHKALHDFI